MIQDVGGNTPANPGREEGRTATGTHRRQLVVNLDALKEAPTMRLLAQPFAAVMADEVCERLLDRFLANNTLYAQPIIDQSEKPIALLDRKQFVEFFSTQYAREIFGRRSIRELLAHRQFKKTDPVVVEGSCTVDDMAQIVIDAGMEHMVTGFLVCSQGRYLGVAHGHDLFKVITERKQAELYFLAHFDKLTGIPNRLLLSDRLEQACRDAERSGHPVALLFVDLDRFKMVNDSLGHSAGDAVLRKVAERLKSCARRADTVARLGGDEFAVLMERIADPGDVDVVAERIVKAMQMPIALLGHSLVVTVSVGSAIYPADEPQASALLGKADAAMYEVKIGGRNGHRRYSSGTPMYKPESVLLENELRQAIERNELLLHYQPQVQLASQEILGVEALVRWRHPVRGLVPPLQFIPIAEESGLIVPLGEWVIREALSQLNSWQARGVAPARISINVSALQVSQRRFPDFLKAAFQEYGVDPRLVELELTESALMRNADEVLQTLNEIKALGVTLAIDDFGTGYSSLSYLRRFPIDRLKIDQSFVRDIERLPTNESIARAIVALANSLSLGIIAEGIENSAEKAVIERLGCREGQGYMFSKPLPADALFELLAKPESAGDSADLARSSEAEPASQSLPRQDRSEPTLMIPEQRVRNVLFLCTHNSARSLMAEAILNSPAVSRGRFKGYSAGSHPSGTPNPHALDCIRRAGLPTEGLRSKDWSEFSAPDAPKLDYVFTVCDAAAQEACPAWPGQPMTAHWGTADPSMIAGDDEQKRRAFAVTFLQLSRRIDIFVNLPFAKLDKLSLQKKLDEIGD